ncbi:MAG: dUTP diphosphatase [Candidatus Margulisbacteria bacterium]|nr:dUTP diphosphatase [Candidatus Margulisiibacteriota bacterium]MBU1021823.1 dUTP diphosphatase [Candidatus Margulisiibacteriota bacterium]MBU1728982.1 dUTP diphosphatase [Candidatus Margulisiibacteriota bacterium]MBU1954465.1 dUTP diphosphatase [Candidatus Margulisiibacteriota bacterium]
MVKIQVKRHEHGKDIPLPQYMTEHAAGMDLFAAVYEDTTIPKKSHKLIPTGISIAIPEGYEAQVRPRSGLALKKGISVLNTPGTIDADYRGEVGVILVNHGNEDFTVKRGDRIAQMIINEIVKIKFEEVSELPESKRSSGGFGHTGHN